MKHVRVFAGIAFGLLVFASVVASYLQPSPEDVARQQCTEQGVAAEKLAILSHRGSRMPVGAWETVEFQIKGSNPPKKLVAELRQPVFFLLREVVEFREEPLR
jgi:hypothetical protein